MMACGLSKSLGFSSSLKKQQGIVTILGGNDSDISSNTLSAPSLRRTFSADLSSKKWVSQNGFSPMKLTDEEVEGSRSGSDIWAQIQQDKNNNNNNKEDGEIKRAQSDVWSSIISDKKKTDSTAPPPYIHPLMKRASSLSEKSLEICTESLGSETGCEVFSSYPSSESGESEIEEASLVLNVTETKEEQVVVVTETEPEQEPITVQDHAIELPRGSFPPPIRSLTTQSGSSLHMKTHRDNGRLVLEAVSMPSHNNFAAKREDGRLLLAFAEISNEPIDEIDIDDEIESEIEWFDEEDKEEEPEELAYKPNGVLYKLAQKPIGPVTVHRLAHKAIGIPKRNLGWAATNEFDTKVDMCPPVVHSLPPRPRVAQLARSTKPPSTVDDTVGAACFNTCDYFWKPSTVEAFGANTKPNFQVQKIVNGNDGWINGCKERRRSLLSVEPFCIAT